MGKKKDVNDKTEANLSKHNFPNYIINMPDRHLFRVKKQNKKNLTAYITWHSPRQNKTIYKYNYIN